VSIFGSLEAPDDEEHEDNCAIWIKEGSFWHRDDEGTCTCGTPDAPLVYQGSHVMPSEDDERGGHLDIALIPGHVRMYRDNPDTDSAGEDDLPPEPYLRFGVNESVVILTRRNVEQIHATLTWWLEATA